MICKYYFFGVSNIHQPDETKTRLKKMSSFSIKNSWNTISKKKWRSVVRDAAAQVVADLGEEDLGDTGGGDIIITVTLRADVPLITGPIIITRTRPTILLIRITTHITHTVTGTVTAAATCKSNRNSSSKIPYLDTATVPTVPSPKATTNATAVTERDVCEAATDANA
jgi:hypothetical protein